MDYQNKSYRELSELLREQKREVAKIINAMNLKAAPAGDEIEEVRWKFKKEKVNV